MEGNNHSADEDIELNDDIGTKGYSKRQFLKLASIMGGGIIGFRKAVRKAFGKEPEGVPLVLTTGKHGEPDRVTYIPKERKRRLELYYNLDVEAYKEKYPAINGFTVEFGSSPTDVKLKFLMDKNTFTTRRKLPNRIKNTPVTYEVVSDSELKPMADRANDRFSKIQANINCGAEESSIYTRGTITATGYYDAGSGGGAVLTAAHTVENAVTDDLYHPYNGPGRNYAHDTSIGQQEEISYLSSSGMDIALYKFDSGYYTLDPRATQSSEQPDITGAWTYQGITNEIDPIAEDGPKATFVGIHTVQRGCEAVRTRRGHHLDYQVDYFDDYGVVEGDSGGPFVDSDGKLLSHLSGTYYNDTIDRGKNVAMGGAGQELFNRVSFSLYP